MKLYGAIDLHSNNNVVVILDEQDKVVLEKRLPNDLQRVLLELAPYRESLESIAVESTFNWYWLVDGLAIAGYSVKLAHVLGLAMITAAKVKTDKRDAFTLARLLRVQAIPEAHIYPRAERGTRDVLRRRLSLVRLRAEEYGSIRRMLYRYGVLDHSRRSTALLTEDKLASYFDDAAVKLHARQEIERIRLYSEQINELEAQLLSVARERPEFHRLLQLPGVADILALTILYETGPVARFASARHYSSYCRVVPGIGQSGLAPIWWTPDERMSSRCSHGKEATEVHEGVQGRGGQTGEGERQDSVRG